MFHHPLLWCSSSAWAAAEKRVDWWETQRDRFRLFVSSIVIEEAERGDLESASRRLAALENIPFLVVTDAVLVLSKYLLAKGALPKKALDDSLHVAIAVVHNMDFLLTWNCRHIDNAETKPIIRNICGESGYSCPEICTPQDLMGVL